MKHFMGKHAKYLQKWNNLKVHTIVVLKITLNICSFFHMAYAYRMPTRYCWSWRYSLASRSCLVKNKSIICIYPGVTNSTVKIITKYMQEDMTSELNTGRQEVARCQERGGKNSKAQCHGQIQEHLEKATDEEGKGYI